MTTTVTITICDNPDCRQPIPYTSEPHIWAQKTGEERRHYCSWECYKATWEVKG